VRIERAGERYEMPYDFYDGDVEFITIEERV